MWDQARGGARLCQSCAVELEIATAVKTRVAVSTHEKGRRRSGGADATTDPTWTTAWQNGQSAWLWSAGALPADVVVSILTVLAGDSAWMWVWAIKDCSVKAKRAKNTRKRRAGPKRRISIDFAAIPFTEPAIARIRQVYAVSGIPPQPGTSCTKPRFPMETVVVQPRAASASSTAATKAAAIVR